MNLVPRNVTLDIKGKSSTEMGCTLGVQFRISYCGVLWFPNRFDGLIYQYTRMAGPSAQIYSCWAKDIRISAGYVEFFPFILVQTW